MLSTEYSEISPVPDYLGQTMTTYNEHKKEDPELSKLNVNAEINLEHHKEEDSHSSSLSVDCKPVNINKRPTNGTAQNSTRKSSSISTDSGMPSMAYSEISPVSDCLGHEMTTYKEHLIEDPELSKQNANAETNLEHQTDEDFLSSSLYLDYKPVNVKNLPKHTDYKKTVIEEDDIIISIEWPTIKLQKANEHESSNKIELKKSIKRKSQRTSHRLLSHQHHIL